LPHLIAPSSQNFAINTPIKRQGQLDLAGAMVAVGVVVLISRVRAAPGGGVYSVIGRYKVPMTKARGSLLRHLRGDLDAAQ